jgi:hypothetical protein
MCCPEISSSRKIEVMLKQPLAHLFWWYYGSGAYFSMSVVIAEFISFIGCIFFTKDWKRRLGYSREEGLDILEKKAWIFSRRRLGYSREEGLGILSTYLL